MKSDDYTHAAEDYLLQADAVKPGPEHEALIATARQYRPHDNWDNWVASKELQPPASTKQARCALVRCEDELERKRSVSSCFSLHPRSS
jgi:hypothetical protein